ncbi:MAG: WD40 repeat domain-containing protein, partial [Acidobacteriales bacterium]|nr:WD40 repeat domain-containing protein [Terriglobales bacterium]
ATTVYAVAEEGTTLIPINTSNNTAGTAINLPANQKKNSAVFAPNGSRLFLGTDGGLLSIDVNTNTLAANITNAPGKVLAVSPDSNLVLISDPGAAALRVFNGSAGTVSNFTVLNATAADFSPDGSKAYIVAGDSPTNRNKLLVLLGSNSPSTFTLPGDANDVTVLASGSAAYVATAQTSQVLTCNNSIQPGPGGAHTLVGSSFDGKQILGVTNTSINAFDVTVTPGGASSPSACPTVTPGPLATHSTGSNDTPAQLVIAPDSTKAFVTSRDRTGSVLAYDIGANAAAGTTSTISLAGGTAATTTGGVTPDSRTLYVGGTDNNVHVIDIATATDTAQVPVSFTPDFVAVRPR